MISLFKKRTWTKTYEFKSEEGAYVHQIFVCQESGALKHIKKYRNTTKTKIIKPCQVK
jgi:hypothetical protein